MTSVPRVLFLGNHTVGVRSLGVLAKEANLVGVVAHPEDPEDGVCYESVFVAAQSLNIPVLRTTGRSRDLDNFVKQVKPDLLWVTDYRYLLPQPVLMYPCLGAVNLHPSLLPSYRGRASINWAILNGETRLGLTAHWLDNGIDTGDIISQRSFALAQDQDVADALAILYPIYQTLTAKVLQKIRSGDILKYKQDETKASVFPRRTPCDGLIDWQRSALDVWNLVRAVAPPYPGAFSPWQGGVLRIYRVRRMIPFSIELKPHPPGSLVSGGITGAPLVIACADQCIEVSSYEFNYVQ